MPIVWIRRKPFVLEKNGTFSARPCCMCVLRLVAVAALQLPPDLIECLADAFVQACLLLICAFGTRGIQQLVPVSAMLGASAGSLLFLRMLLSDSWPHSLVYLTELSVSAVCGLSLFAW